MSFLLSCIATPPTKFYILYLFFIFSYLFIHSLFCRWRPHKVWDCGETSTGWGHPEDLMAGTRTDTPLWERGRGWMRGMKACPDLLPGNCIPFSSPWIRHCYNPCISCSRYLFVSLSLSLSLFISISLALALSLSLPLPPLSLARK